MEEELPEETTEVAENENAEEEEGGQEEVSEETAASTRLPHKRRYGLNKVFCFSKDEPLCSLGPHVGIFSFCLIGFEGLGAIVYFTSARIQPARHRVRFRSRFYDLAPQWH